MLSAFLGIEALWNPNQQERARCLIGTRSWHDQVFRVIALSPWASLKGSSRRLLIIKRGWLFSTWIGMRSIYEALQEWMFHYQARDWNLASVGMPGMMLLRLGWCCYACIRAALTDVIHCCLMMGLHWFAACCRSLLACEGGNLCDAHGIFISTILRHLRFLEPWSCPHGIAIGYSNSW